MQQKETGAQGSSCAVEVGGHLQVCSIIVENLNKQGMVLIEVCYLFFYGCFNLCLNFSPKFCWCVCPVLSLKVFWVLDRCYVKNVAIFLR